MHIEEIQGLETQIFHRLPRMDGAGGVGICG